MAQTNTNTNTLPLYQNLEDNVKIILENNKNIFAQLRIVLDNIEDIDTKGVESIHDNYIRQLMKAFNNDYLYQGFDVDYKYVLTKLSLTITCDNNFALRSINEAVGYNYNKL